MRPSRVSYAFLLSFAIAIFFLQWFQQPSYPPVIWLTLCTLCPFCALCTLFPRTRTAAAILLATTFGLSLALFSVARTTHVPSSGTIDWYAGGSGSALITGMIADAPDRRANATKYVVAVQSIRSGKQEILVTGNILVTDHSVRPYEYGDRVTVRGALQKPGVIEDFRYDQYLSRYDIYAMIYRATLSTDGANGGNPFLRVLYGFRRDVEDRITQLYPEPQSSLLIGLLTGSRGSMPDDLTEQFKVTGLTHLIAISGYNITMVITVLSMLLFWLPLRWRFVPSLLLITAFTLFTGAGASVVRAAVMGGLGLLALQLGRVQTPRLTLLWTVCVMLAWNPKELWYDAGFQLSFLAFIGITEIAPLLEYCVKVLPEKFGIRQASQLTLAAQIATLPWMLHLFGRLSVIAPVANLLAPPLVPWSMLFGTLSLLGSLVSPALAHVLSLPGYLTLSGITLVTHFLAQLPSAAVGTGKTGTAFLVIPYGILGALVWRREWKERAGAEAEGRKTSP